MNVQNLLSRLQKVKQVGSNRWLACCPAHDDRHPSLGVNVNELGKISIRCWSRECDGRAIMESVGLQLVDLYPDQIDPPKGIGKPLPHNPNDILLALAGEAQLIAMLGSELADHPLNHEDRKRLFQAVSRIKSALRLAGIKHVL